MLSCLPYNPPQRKIFSPGSALQKFRSELFTNHDDLRMKSACVDIFQKTIETTHVQITVHVHFGIKLNKKYRIATPTACNLLYRICEDKEWTAWQILRKASTLALIKCMSSAAERKWHGTLCCDARITSASYSPLSDTKLFNLATSCQQHN